MNKPVMMTALMVLTLVARSFAEAPTVEASKPAPEKTVYHITGESEISYAVPVKILLAFDRTAGGRTNGVTGTITLNPAPNAAGVAGIQTPVVGELFVDVAAFRSGIGKRDASVRNLLEFDKYPRIRFAISGVEPRNNLKADSLSGAYVVSGTLEIRGVAKEVSFPVDISPRWGGLAIDGNFSIRLTDFGVTPPSLAIFVGQASDEVALNVHLIAEGIKPGLFASK